MTRHGWAEAAEQLGLEISETSDLGVPTALGGTIDGFLVDVIHDPGALDDTTAQITVTIRRPLSAAIFEVGPYEPPPPGTSAFYRPLITSDPPFNVRFSIRCEPDHRDAAIAFLDARRRSLLMSLQAVRPHIVFRSLPDRATLSCSSERRPRSESLVRIIQAKIRVAEVLDSLSPPGEPA